MEERHTETAQKNKIPRKKLINMQDLWSSEVHFKTLMKYTKDLCKWKNLSHLDKKDLKLIVNFPLVNLKF